MDLSLVLCSRNDAYMGNSRWRLETTLNSVAATVERLGRADAVEILVADWGSETPLRNAVQLEPAAARMVAFVTIPPDLARARQGDSPFPEVLALNAAVRRARGRYVGRIDQDTLVGDRFFRWFFAELASDAADRGATTLYFANRRGIPFRLASTCPDRRQIDRFLRLCGPWLHVWRTNPTYGDEFWSSWVGIWLAHRDRWQECGGYDERMIYYNWMETDMIRRLRAQYRVADLGRLTAYDFYHLDHVNPRRETGTARPPRNPDLDRADPAPTIHPNGPAWGLADCELPREPVAAAVSSRAPHAAWSWVAFVALIVRLGLGLAWDRVAIGAARAASVVRRRASAARSGVADQPIHLWPATLWKLWSTRKVSRAR